jgi:hypothetical protein
VGSYGQSAVYQMPYNSLMNTRTPGTNLILPMGTLPHSSVGTTPNNLFVNGTNMSGPSNAPPVYPFPGFMNNMQPRIRDSFFFNANNATRPQYPTIIPPTEGNVSFPSDASFCSSGVPMAASWIKDAPKPGGFPDQSTNPSCNSEIHGDMVSISIFFIIT